MGQESLQVERVKGLVSLTQVTGERGPSDSPKICLWAELRKKLCGRARTGTNGVNVPSVNDLEAAFQAFEMLAGNSLLQKKEGANKEHILALETFTVLTAGPCKSCVDSLYLSKEEIAKSPRGQSGGGN